MNNWQKIIESYASKSYQNTGKYIDAVIVSVREDYLRATVKLITGQTIENMLNKTREILEVGQNVKIKYLTVPSKGWIALTYGESHFIGEKK